MNKRRLLFSILFFFSLSAYCQDETGDVMNLTLEDIINLAREKSTSAFRAQTNKEYSYWQYRTFRSNYNPQLVLSGTLPSFTLGYTPTQQEDGSYRMKKVNRDISNIRLGIVQSVGLTGGEITVGSSIQRNQYFSDIEFGMDPVSIELRQPLFSYNDLRWAKKIEPLRYEESVKYYAQDLEEISITATRLFFDLMLAQVDFIMAQNNLANNDTIYKIAEGRYNLGNIAENDLLQLELNVMNSRQAVAQARLDLQTSRLRLRSFVGFTQNQNIELTLPDNIPIFEVDLETALSQARKNRSDAVAFKRRTLEAQSAVARAKGQTGFEADLIGGFGLSSSALQFSDLYSTEQAPMAFARLGLTLPILDWGRSQSRIKTAEANQKLTEYAVSQDEVTFNEEIITQVQSFTMLKSQVEISQVAAEIGQRSYDISKNRFLIGKISITDLNDSLEKKDSSRRRYIQSLREFWEAYFNLRALTLFDFQKNEVLVQN